MNILKKNWLLILSLLFVFTSSTFGHPFLYNVANVVSSASAASSSPQSSNANIADLRKIKIAKYSNEKQPFDSEDLFLLNDNKENEMMNEAAPSLIQKKITKILRKISYLTSLINPGNTPDINDDGDFENHNGEPDLEKDELDKDLGVDPIRNGTLTAEMFNKTQSNEPNSEVEDLEGFVNNIAVSGNVKRKKEAQLEDFNVAPNHVAVFFTELLGSLVGLVYGAAAQFNRPTTTSSELSF